MAFDGGLVLCCGTYQIGSICSRLGECIINIYMNLFCIVPLVSFTTCAAYVTDKRPSSTCVDLGFLPRLSTTQVHAMQTNEIFLLVGEVMAQISTAFAKDMRVKPGADGSAVDDDVSAAGAPFADFVQEPWWDVAVARDGRDEQDGSSSPSCRSDAGCNGAKNAAAAALPGTLRALCEESSALLRSAFALALGPLPASLELALTAEMFGRVVGMFEQNNVGVRAPSPIPEVLRKLLSSSEDDCDPRGISRDILGEVVQLVGEVMDEEYDDDEEEGVSSMCCGGEDGASDGDDCCGTSVAVSNKDDARVEQVSSTCCGGEGGGSDGDDCCGTSVAISREDDPRVAQLAEEDGGYTSMCCGGEEGGNDGCCGTPTSVGGGFAEGKNSADEKTPRSCAAGDALRGPGAVPREERAVLERAIDGSGDAGEDEVSLFAPLDGTALYSVICCMNHSCRPNCLVRYPGRRREKATADPEKAAAGVASADPLVAEVVLLEDVPAGEELTQSYVNRDMSFVERRQALEDYGFFCTCPRCLEEEAMASS